MNGLVKLTDSSIPWLTNVADDAIFYVVKDGISYKTTKQSLFAGIGVGMYLPEGTGVVINRPAYWVSTNFDLNPASADYLKGLGSMSQWRIKPQNGGRVSVGWDPNDYPTIGATGGSKDAVVVKHKHKSVVWADGKPAVNTIGTGSRAPGHALNEDSATDNIDETSEVGVDGAGKNMQPYIVELHIELMVDIFIGGSSYQAYVNVVVWDGVSSVFTMASGAKINSIVVDKSMLNGDEFSQSGDDVTITGYIETGSKITFCGII